MSVILNNTSAFGLRPRGGVCLSMIVKNEADVIVRCLRSVLPFISSWSITDTGSTDGTQAIIQEMLGHLPGQLSEFEWNGSFSDARNHSWAHALKFGPSHLMFLDADEVLETDGIPLFTNDACLINVLHDGRENLRYFMVRADYPFRWEGIVHEDIPPHGKIALLPDAKIISHLDGARAKDKESRDASDMAGLLKMLDENPENSRALFYLGATYAMRHDYENAKECFERRVVLGGNPYELERAQAFLDGYQQAQQATKGS